MIKLSTYAILAFLLLSTNVGSQAPRTLSMALQAGPADPRSEAAARLANLVSLKSGGAITIKVYPAGELGDAMSTLTGVQLGTIDLAVVSTSLMASKVDAFAVFDIPFAAATAARAMAVEDGPLGMDLLKSVEARGFVGLAYWGVGFRQLTSAGKPVAKASDFKGLKIRSTPADAAQWSALGANPTSLPFAEVHTALQNGAVDAQESSLATIERARLYEVQKSLTQINRLYDRDVVIMSEKAWRTLNAMEQGLIKEAIVEATKYEREQVSRANAQALERLRMQGIHIQALEYSEFERLRALSAPIASKYRERLGPTIVTDYFAQTSGVNNPPCPGSQCYCEKQKQCQTSCSGC